MADPEGGATGRARYHHGNLRPALVEAAAALLEEAGLAGLSLRAVARRAGVSQTAPYRHFADKAALLAAVAAQGFAGLRAALEAEARAARDDRDRLRRLARGYVRFAHEHRALFGLMFGAERHAAAETDELAAAAQAAYGVIWGAVAQRAGGQAPSATLAAWALVHGLATLVNDGVVAPDGPGPAGLDALVDRVAAHLRLGPEGEAR